MAENRPRMIGDLCKDGLAAVQTGPFGSQLHSYDYVERGVPVVPTEAMLRRRIDLQRANHVTAKTAKRLDRHRLKLGDILFARRGIQATGLSAIVTGEQEGALCGTGAILLRIQKGNSIVDPSFLSFVLATNESIAWFKQHAVGAVMPNLNDSIIKRFPLRLPPIREQLQIASALHLFERKIELNRLIDMTLDVNSRMIFKSWFVDFDPVGAKGEGRRPFGLDAELSALFASTFGQSSIGIVPTGWTPGALQDIGRVRTERV